MLELLTNIEMAEADRLAIASGISGATLMENAGRAVADMAAALHPAGSRIVVVAGPGNNGGDGFVAARILSDQGFDVRVLMLGAKEHLVGDAAAVAQRWAGATEPAHPDAIGKPQAIID